MTMRPIVQAVPAALFALPLFLFGVSFVAPSVASAETCRFLSDEGSSLAWVSGSGVRLREKEDLTGSIKGVLKFNEVVCVMPGTKGPARLVAPEVFNASAGWIDAKYLAAQPFELKNAQNNLTAARSKNDWPNAILWAERIVDMTSASELLPALKELRTVLEQSGEKKRASAVTDLVREQEAKEARGLIGADLEEWFFTKFGDTSPYFIPPPVGEVSENDLDQVFRTLLAPLDYDGRGEEIRRDMADILARSVYPAVFDESGVPLAKSRYSKRIAQRLLDPVIATETFHQYPDVLLVFPDSIFRNEEFFATVLAACPKTSFPLWTRLTPEQRQKFPKEILACLVPRTDFGKFISQAGLPDSENFALEFFTFSAANGHKARLPLFYQALSPRLRENSRILEALMAPNVTADIYASLSPELQKNPKMKAYAVKTSSCDDVMKANPKDSPLFEAILKEGRLTESCPSVLDASLAQSVPLAVRIANQLPRTVNFMAPNIKFHPEVASSAVKSKALKDEECPYVAPMETTVVVAARIARARRACLVALRKDAFNRPDIRRIVVDGTIDKVLMPQLPDSYTLDPKVYVKLEWEELTMDFARLFSSPEMLLSVARRHGVQQVREFFDEIGDGDGESTRISIFEDPVYDAAFWKMLVAAAKAHKDSCEQMAEFIKRAAIPEQGIEAFRKGTKCEFSAE